MAVSPGFKTRKMLYAVWARLCLSEAEVIQANSPYEYLHNKRFAWLLYFFLPDLAQYYF